MSAEASPAHSRLRKAPVALGLLPAEAAFYGDYAWCLNPYPTFGEAIIHLRAEAGKLGTAPESWQSREAAVNVFLLASALLNCADEFLRGPTLKLPRMAASTSPGRAARWAAEWIWASRRGLTDARRWRDGWVTGLNTFLTAFVRAGTASPASLAAAGANLAGLLRWTPPAALQDQQISVPSPFRRLDMTHVDVVSLAQCFVQRFPDRSLPILLVGLRTSGTYFAALARACLEIEGYAQVSCLTMEPNKGLGRWERKALHDFARRGYTAVLVDDPPNTAGTIFVSFDIARRAGFAAGRVKALVPIHPAKRNWPKHLPDDLVVALAPERWHMRSLLEPEAVHERLKEYFGQANFTDVRVVESHAAAAFNAASGNAALEMRGAHLKRIFEVRLTSPQGGEETRFVLAKSVGGGWLGYHAFLAGQRLAGLVPPILGLRDGILYMEWIPQSASDADNAKNRTQRIDAAAAYVAARAGALRLASNPLLGKGQQRHHNGLKLLEKTLCKAYGRLLTDALMQKRLGQRLRQLPCPAPTLIDGTTARQEWITGPQGLLKTDFEQHGMGKAELNVIDPAYDLADAIFSLALTPGEAGRLVRRYAEAAGDASVDRRLFMNKLLAGFWAMEQAQDTIFGKQQTRADQGRLHRQFMSAWNFLTVQTAYHCGSLCRRPASPGWRAPLVMLDIDGVIDSRLFGFPSTTAAGIKAIALLHAHGFSVALNTARSVAEVKDYCAAYGLSGGAAEHGAYVWDAVAQQGRSLLSAETLRQLDTLRAALRKLPGVFLDDRHHYSIRAFTYQEEPRGLIATVLTSLRASSVGDGALAPLPPLTINALMRELGLDRLSFHQTSIDTTVTAREADKGSGLRALRDWVLGPQAETIAVGDSEPDLAMFRAATRCFAPANISCAPQARLLGCTIASKPHQRGLLEIARRIVHADGKVCARCTPGDAVSGHTQDDLFFELLQAADRGWAANLGRAIFGPLLAPFSGAWNSLARRTRGSKTG